MCPRCELRWGPQRPGLADRPVTPEPLPTGTGAGLLLGCPQMRSGRGARGFRAALWVSRVCRENLTVLLLPWGDGAG